MRRIDWVVAAVTGAADQAMALWSRDGAKVAQWEKRKGQPVCDADIAIDEQLKTSLAAIDPDAAWLSEETADTRKRLKAERLWVVDPIDGTRDYLRGRTGWAVSVALVEQGEVVLGVLAAPARGETWLAERGAGATRNGVRLVASQRTSFTGARVPADQLSQMDSDLYAVAKPNSIALRMAMVAADEADLMATVRWGNEWDIAAASLIAREAGATVTDALGRPLRFNRQNPTALGVLCCAPAIHAAAVERLAGRARAVLRVV
jgi:myo-inositol-1(or 4)-monophosphatase